MNIFQRINFITGNVINYVLYMKGSDTSKLLVIVREEYSINTYYTKGYKPFILESRKILLCI